jgi:hypothetical protein
MVQWVKQQSTGDYADEVTWKPTEPEELVGKIVSKKTVDAGKYGPSVVIKIEDENGVVNNVWMNRGGLKDILEQWDDSLTVGREVGLRMTGMVNLKNGNTFYPYEIGFSDDVPASAASSLGATVVDGEVF